MAEATASTKAFGGTVLATAQKNQAAFTTLGIAGLALAGGLGVAMKRAADAAIEFESSFAGVRKTVDATEPEFAALAQGFRDMAKEIPVNVNELNRIGEAAGQLGISQENILGFARVMADLGVATNLSSDQAATALARLANIMQTPQTQFDRLGSTIVALGNNLATTESELTEFGLRIAGAGQIAGLAESDVLAIGAAMSSVGVEAEAGGTAVQKVLIGITEAVTTGSPKLAQFAAAAGMSAQEFAEAWRTAPVQAFTAFVEGLGTSGNQAIAVLKELGLTDQRLVRSFLSLANAGDLLRGSVDLSSRAWEQNNALTEEAEKRYDTTASKIQIAKNRITDAAISFGQLLLPAVAAVVGAFGDLADLVGGLPAPVRAVALAIGALSAGVLALGGGALLLLPRLVAMKAALAGIGIQGGLLRGSFALAVRAINPYTLAIGGAVAALTIWMTKSAEARQRVEELAGTFDQATGAITENTRAFVVQRLEQEGALALAGRLGVSTAELTDAVIEGGSAWRELTVSLQDVVDQYNNSRIGTYENATAHLHLLDILKGIGGEFDAAAESAERKAQAMGQDAEATGAAGDAASGAGAAVRGGLNPALEEAGDLADEAADAAERFRAALEGLKGGALDVEKASLNWLNTVRRAREELRKGTKTLKESTQAGRDNRDAIVRMIDAAKEHAAAIAEKTDSEQRATRVAIQHAAEIIEVATAAGLAEREVRNYIRQLGLTPKQIRTLFKVDGIDKAEDQLGAFFRRWDGRRINTFLGVTTPSEVRAPHAGGFAGSAPRRFHGGGDVAASLRGNEVLTVLERGEWVTDKDTARRHRDLLAALPRLHGGEPVSMAALVSARSASSGGLPDIQVILREIRINNRLDRRRFTEELNHDVAYSGRWA